MQNMFQNELMLPLIMSVAALFIMIINTYLTRKELYMYKIMIETMLTINHRIIDDRHDSNQEADSGCAMPFILLLIIISGVFLKVFLG